MAASAVNQADSKAVFAQDMKDLELTVLEAKFKTEGWVCHADFAHCTSDPMGATAKEEFEKVIKDVLATDGSQKHLVPRLRRLHQKSYITITTAIQESATSNPMREDRDEQHRPL